MIPRINIFRLDSGSGFGLPLDIKGMLKVLNQVQLQAPLEPVGLVVVVHDARLRMTFSLVTAQPVIDRADVGESFPVGGDVSGKSNGRVYAAYIPNSETKRPERMSQLCQGSCDP